MVIMVINVIIEMQGIASHTPEAVATQFIGLTKKTSAQPTPFLYVDTNRSPHHLLLIRFAEDKRVMFWTCCTTFEARRSRAKCVGQPSQFLTKDLSVRHTPESNKGERDAAYLECSVATDPSPTAQDDKRVLFCCAQTCCVCKKSVDKVLFYKIMSYLHYDHEDEIAGLRMTKG
jgi:hypothetical protein